MRYDVDKFWKKFQTFFVLRSNGEGRIAAVLHRKYINKNNVLCGFQDETGEGWGETEGAKGCAQIFMEFAKIYQQNKRLRAN